MMIRRTIKPLVPRSLYMLGHNGKRYKLHIEMGVKLDIGDVITSDVKNRYYMYIGIVVPDELSECTCAKDMLVNDYAFIDVYKATGSNLWIDRYSHRPVSLFDDAVRFACVPGFNYRTRHEALGSCKYRVEYRNALHIRKTEEDKNVSSSQA